jgi:hypothetical protein
VLEDAQRGDGRHYTGRIEHLRRLTPLKAAETLAPIEYAQMIMFDDHLR